MDQIHDVQASEERNHALQTSKSQAMSVERAMGNVSGAQDRVHDMQGKSVAAVDSMNEATKNNAATAAVLAQGVTHMAQVTSQFAGNLVEMTKNMGALFARPAGKSGGEVVGETIQELIRQAGGVAKAAVNGPVGELIQGMIGQATGAAGRAAHRGPVEAEERGAHEPEGSGEAPEPGAAAHPDPGAAPRRPDVSHLVAVLLENVPEHLRQEAVDALADPDRLAGLQNTFIEEILRGRRR